MSSIHVISTMVVVSLAGACVIGGGSEPADDASDAGPPPAAQSGWAVGGWFAPEYTNGTGPDRPMMSMGLDPDGTWQHYTNGSRDGGGQWQLQGGALTIEGARVERMPNCMAISFGNSSFTRAVYYRHDAPAACPDTPAALTPAERCLVGEFRTERSYNSTTETFTRTRTANRLEVYEQNYLDLAGSDDAHYTQIHSWSITNGQLCVQDIGGSPSCTQIDWAEVETGRQGTAASGCVLPVNLATLYCAHQTGVSSSGIGCSYDNVGGSHRWNLSCDDHTHQCRCERDGTALWSGRSGDYNACGSPALWGQCCGM